jgi:hypothetical protein
MEAFQGGVGFPPGRTPASHTRTAVLSSRAAAPGRPLVVFDRDAVRTMRACRTELVGDRDSTRE